MEPIPFDMAGLYDANADWRAGRCPWTFFAYPKSSADECGLPADLDVQRLVAMLLTQGIQVGIWSEAVPENTIYLACPQEDISRLHAALQEIEQAGLIEKGFLSNRCERLFSSAGAYAGRDPA